MCVSVVHRVRELLVHGATKASRTTRGAMAMREVTDVRRQRLIAIGDVTCAHRDPPVDAYISEPGRCFFVSRRRIAVPKGLPIPDFRGTCVAGREV